MTVMPSSMPHPHAVVVLTGCAELMGTIGLFLRPTRPWAGAMLALYAVCVYPANILHAVHDLSTGTGLGWAFTTLASSRSLSSAGGRLLRMAS
jgi:uncharacterized membrane protein